MKWAGMTRLEKQCSLWLGLKRAAGMGVQSGSPGRGCVRVGMSWKEHSRKKKKKTKGVRAPTHDAKVR